MAGYTKLFSSIIASTIWRANHETRILWITLLAMSDRAGNVEGSIPGLADMARLSIPACRKALTALESPDPDSRSKAHGGRRILTVDGGWFVVNYADYRKKMSADDRREYLRLKKAESRGRQQLVNTGQQMSTLSTHTDPDPKADPYPEKIKTLHQSTSRPSPPASPRKKRSASVAPPDFVIFWNAYPRRTGKGAALKAWAKHTPALAAVLKALDWQARQPAWTKDNGQFIPHPATWLNRQGWEDEPFETPATKRPAVDWQDECAIIHGGACKSRYLHELMAQPEQDVK